MKQLTKKQLREVSKNVLKSSLTSAVDEIEKIKDIYDENDYAYIVSKVSEFSIYLRQTIDSLM